MNGRTPHMKTLLPLGLVLGLIGCTQGSGGCDGQGCGAVYGYPQSSLPNGVAPVVRGVEARLTQAGVDFLQDRLPALVEGLADTLPSDIDHPAFFRLELTDPLVLSSSPRTALGVSSTGQYSRPTYVWIRKQPLLEELRFAFLEGAVAGIGAHVEELALGIDARMYAKTLTTEAACSLYGTNDDVCPPEAGSCGDLPLLTNVSFDVVLTPSIGNGAACDDPSLGPCLRFDVDVANVVLGDFGSGAIEIDPTPRCTGSNPPADCDGVCDSSPSWVCELPCDAGDFLTDGAATLAGLLSNALEDTLSDLINDALGDALADLDGSPASMSGRIVLSELVSGLPIVATDLGFLLGPDADTFDVNCVTGTDCSKARGMDVHLHTGVEAAPATTEDGDAPPHPCVLQLEGETFEALYGAAEFTAPLDVALTGERQGVAYHLGVSVVRGALNQALFAAHQSGALCLALGSDEIRALSDGGFPFSAGTLNTLTGGLLEGYTPSAAPALLALAPASPPLVRYGAGTDDEGHVLVDWRDLRLNFYVYLFERYARLVAVDVDVALSLRAVYDEETGTLELAVVSGPSLDHYRQVYGELLPEVDFVELLEGLVGSLLDQALGDQLQFQLDLGLGALLSDALGTPLEVRLQDIATTGPGGTREHLQLYFEIIEPVTAEARTRALRPGPLRIVPSTTAIAVQDLGPDANEEVEALFRVDDGTWRGPVSGALGALSFPLDPPLVTGEHRLSMRLRPRGSHGAFVTTEGTFTTSSTPSGRPPRLRLRLTDQGLLAEATATDEVLRWRWSLDGKSVGFVESPLLGHEELEGHRRVTIEAQTTSGLTTRPHSVDLATRRWQRR